MRRSLALTAAAFISSSTAWPVAAQTSQPSQSQAGSSQPEVTLPLPEQVVTATRVPTPLSEIPAGVTVIDRATIDAHGSDTLAQALAGVPGVEVSPSGGQGGQASIFIRGSNSNHVLVLRDGMPLTDASDPTDAFNFGIDTLGDVERIEIIRGPMAAVYGSGAIGGVINLISRRGSEPGAHWSGYLAGGYPALIRGSLTASGIEGPVDYAVTVDPSRSAVMTDPQRESVYAGVPLGFRGPDRHPQSRLHADRGHPPVTVPARPDSVFRLRHPGRSDLRRLQLQWPDDVLTGTHWRHHKAVRRHAGYGVFVGRLQDDRQVPLEPLAPADPNQTSSDFALSFLPDGRAVEQHAASGRSARRSGPVRQCNDFRLRVHRRHRQVRVNEDFAGFPFAQSATASMTTNAAYVGFQTNLMQRLELTGQVRQDWVDGQSPKTCASVRVYDAHEIGTHFKVAYGTGFRAASLFDRFGVDLSGYVGNPALKPEQSEGWEVGFVTDIPALGRSDFASVGATYFEQQVRDLIVGVFTPIDTVVNLGSAQVHGVETEANLHPVHWLDLHATYTLLNIDLDGSRRVKARNCCGVRRTRRLPA